MTESQQIQQSRPIILIEDDSDDVDIIRHTLEELGVKAELRVFADADAAVEHLKTLTEAPGMVLCDVNLSRQSGVDLRRRLASDKQLHEMSIPFIFLTTVATDQLVRQAYEMPVQGFFIKQNSIEHCKKQMRVILDYWSLSVTPATTNPGKQQNWL